MAESFSDLGLGETLLAATRAAGYERPTALQDAAIPLVRRGANVVLHASSGAGVTATYALGLLDKLSGGASAAGSSPRALVVTPTPETAARIVDAIASLADNTGISVRLAAPGWRHETADIIVTTPTRALEQVQTSGLKLEAVESVVILAADEIFRLGNGESLRTLTSLLTAETQRVLVSASLDGDVARYIESQVRRPMTVPARLADRGEAARHREQVGQVGYMVLDGDEKNDIVARLLDGVQGGALVFARSDTRAARVHRELERRGLAADIRFAAFGTDTEASDRIISYDVPSSAQELKSAHQTGGTVLVTPDELTHFKRIAAEVPYTIKQRRARVLDESALDAYRATVRAALESEDISAHMLVLDPLFEEFSPVEVAAALSAMLRRRTAVPAQAAAASQSNAGAVPREALTGGGTTKLFLSIGTRDAIRPGDIVGAITGEANIKGEQVGLVDIRESFSVVEVNSDVAEKVIRALNGTTMKGRSLRVDFDRKNAGGSSAGGAEPRRSSGPPRSGPRDGPSRSPRGDGPPRKPGPRTGPRDDAGGRPPRRPTER